MTDIGECSCPATIDSRPMNSGRFRNALRYSIRGYWYSWTDCQRHIDASPPAPLPSPLTLLASMLLAHVVHGPTPGPLTLPLFGGTIGLVLTTDPVDKVID